MAEPDAFGRKQNEDPLAAMGWSDAPATPAETEAAAVASDTASTATAGDAFGVPQAEAERRRQAATPPRRRRVRPSTPTFSLGWLPKLLFFGAVLTVIAAVAIPLVIAANDAIDSVEESLPEGPRTEEPRADPERPAVDEDAGPPRGLQPRSMLLRGNLSPAVRNLRARMGGRLHYVRIEAERVDLQVERGGRLRSAQSRWDREPDVFPAVDANAAGSTFAWSQLDPSAPRRFVRTATRRAGQPSGAFDYAVLMNAAGLRWQVFLRDGTHFAASPDGRRVEKVG